MGSDILVFGFLFGFNGCFIACCDLCCSVSLFFLVLAHVGQAWPGPTRLGQWGHWSSLLWDDDQNHKQNAICFKISMVFVSALVIGDPCIYTRSYMFIHIT